MDAGEDGGPFALAPRIRWYPSGRARESPWPTDKDLDGGAFEARFSRGRTGGGVTCTRAGIWEGIRPNGLAPLPLDTVTGLMQGEIVNQMRLADE